MLIWRVHWLSFCTNVSTGVIVKFGRGFSVFSYLTPVCLSMLWACRATIHFFQMFLNTYFKLWINIVSECVSLTQSGNLEMLSHVFKLINTLSTAHWFHHAISYYTVDCKFLFEIIQTPSGIFSVFVLEKQRHFFKTLFIIHFASSLNFSDHSLTGSMFSLL